MVDHPVAVGTHDGHVAFGVHFRLLTKSADRTQMVDLNVVLSMSQMLWDWSLCSLEGIHREVASERPLFAAPQGYLCGQLSRFFLF
jgi:hypothetical protein